MREATWLSSDDPGGLSGASRQVLGAFILFDVTVY